MDVTSEALATSTPSAGPLLVEQGSAPTSAGAASASTLMTSEMRPANTGLGSGECFRQWTIISAGPSMMKVTASDLLKGPVIAINRALSIRNRVPIDIWAVWDHPERLYALGYDKYVYPPLTIWMGPNRFQELYLANMGKVEEPAWETNLHPRIGIRPMPFGWRKSVDEKGKARVKVVFSLIFAIEKAVSLGGQKIRILGADMEGSWRDPLTEEECIAAEKWDRWKWERAQFGAIIEEAKRIGVDIERC